MVLFKGDQIREGRPNPLADMVRGRAKSASGFGPAGPNPRRTKSASTTDPGKNRRSRISEINGGTR